MNGNKWNALILLLLMSVAWQACSKMDAQKPVAITELSPREKLDKYASLLDVTIRPDDQCLLVPSYGCPGCKILVDEHLETLLAERPYRIFLSKPVGTMPQHPNLIIDTAGYLDRMMLSANVITLYTLEDGSITQIDTFTYNVMDLVQPTE